MLNYPMKLGLCWPSFSDKETKSGARVLKHLLWMQLTRFRYPKPHMFPKPAKSNPSLSAEPVEISEYHQVRPPNKQQ